MPRFKTTFVIAISNVLLLMAAAAQSAPAQTFTVIHNFTAGQDGATPIAGLTVDKAGSLYGTAIHGGIYNSCSGAGCGTIYQLKHKGSGWTFIPLYIFTGGKDGAQPNGVIFGPNGTLYGTTANGGDDTYGVVFNLRPLASACKSALCPWAETPLYSFMGFGDGIGPCCDLVFDQKGDIYGVTSLGGIEIGTVYELTPSGGGSYNESVLYSFLGGNDGEDPRGGVILDNAGNLYGTTYGHGLYGYGTVYQLVPSGGGWTENLIYSFQDGEDGGYPYSGLIFDESGNLYGTTLSGGTGGGGTVFELTPSNGSWTFSLVYSFTGSGYCRPTDSLVMDGAGNLYGTTVCDGKYAGGSVFKLTPSGGTWTYTSLHDFTGGSDGTDPFGSVLLHPNGKLYGTAAYGGSHGQGVVWEITP